MPEASARSRVGSPLQLRNRAMAEGDQLQRDDLAPVFVLDIHTVYLFCLMIC